jgi:hypothetical protein
MAHTGHEKKKNRCTEQKINNKNKMDGENEIRGEQEEDHKLDEQV